MGTIAKNGIIYGGSSSSFAPTKISELENDSGFIDVEEATNLINESIDNLEENISNPNLLDNPDFRINQRGLSEYIGEQYTVDRWRAVNNTAVRIFENYIEIEQMGATQASFLQHIENIADLRGKVVTFSAMARGDGINAPKLQFHNPDGDDKYAYGMPSTDWQFLSLTTTIADSATSTLHFPRIYASINNTNKPKIAVKWMKLELGDKATPFVPPNSTIELLKCRK